LVSFGATGAPTQGEQIGVQLYSNGTALTQQNLLQESTTGTNSNLSKTIVFSSDAPTTLELYNSSPNETTYTNAYITVTRLQ